MKEFFETRGFESVSLDADPVVREYVNPHGVTLTIALDETSVSLTWCVECVKAVPGQPGDICPTCGNEFIDLPFTVTPADDDPEYVIYPEGVAAFVAGNGPTVRSHLDAARDFLRTANDSMGEARCYEKWPTLSYKSPPLRDDAWDDLAAAVDTLIAAVADMEKGR